jgi:hypothetical protein
MNSNERKLRSIIKDIISEVVNPWDDIQNHPGSSRGGSAKTPGVLDSDLFPTRKGKLGRRASRDLQRSIHGDAAWGPSDEELDAMGEESLEMPALGSAYGEYVDGVGWVKGEAIGDEIDSSLDAEAGDQGLSIKDFIYVISSQVTRGEAGEIFEGSSGNSITINKDKTVGTMSKMFSDTFQRGSSKSAKDRSTDVVDILMQHDLLVKDNITDEIIDEIGIKGRDSGTIYRLYDYFADYQNRFITESKRRARLLKKNRSRR